MTEPQEIGMTEQELKNQLRIILGNHLMDLDLTIENLKAEPRANALLRLAEIVFDKNTGAVDKKISD